MNNAAAYPSLLAPLEMAGMRLRNRVVHASMGTHFGVNQRVADRLIQYHVNRARGGAAMIVSEPMNTAHHQDVATRVRAWNDDEVDGLKRWAAAVEAEDCRLLGQIQDPGGARHVSGRHHQPIGPSSVPDDISWDVPRPMSRGEIAGYIEEFAHTAARLQRCGFSGVELSSAHGHLFHQFLSPWTNIRSDDYGGDRAGRARFLNELVEAIRALCGRRFIVGLKMPGDDGVPGGVGPEEAGALAVLLTAAGNVDYICFAQGSHARSLRMHIPDASGPRAPYVPLIRELRRSIPGVPVMALGRITDPAEAESILARGDADLIGLGRPLMTDAAWLLKAAQGRAHEIRYCTSRNSCWNSGRKLDCENNPRLGEPDEVDWWPKPAPVSRRVVVVGAGIAGMEAAWVAAARRHAVTVFGRSREVGGKMRLRSLLPGGDSVSSIYDYQFAAARKSGARFELGVTATATEVLALKPDAVVLAAGSSMMPPRWLPQEVRDAGLVPDLRTAMSDVLQLTARQTGTAVIFDMDHTEGTYAAAELLRTRFDRVIVITPRDSIAQEARLTTQQGIMLRFAEQRIETVILAEPRWSESFEEGRLEYANVDTHRIDAIEDVAFFAYATPRVPDDALAEPLRAAGVDVHLIGDCLSPRGAHAATADGHAIGNAL